MEDVKQWHPKRIKCPGCGKYAEFKGYYNGIPEYYCKRCNEVIRWIGGKKFRKVPLPMKVTYDKHWATFEKKEIPPFWRGALGVYQDENNDIWYLSDWKVTFNKKTKLFRLYVDGKPIFVEEAKE